TPSQQSIQQRLPHLSLSGHVLRCFAPARHPSIQQRLRSPIRIKSCFLRLGLPRETSSAPLTWAELTPALEPRRYNLKTIFRRLARQKTDPMAPLLAY